MSDLQPNTQTSRFLFYDGEINRQSRVIKSSLLSKSYPVGFSVFDTTGSSDDEIWQVGFKHVAPSFSKQNRPILGRFDIEARHYMDAGLTFERKEPPPKHYNIHGMPVPSAEQGKALAHRQNIINNGRLVLIEDNQAWTKYGVIADAPPQEDSTIS